MKEIHLPCLRGEFGDWSFFSTIMPVKDVVGNRRIITVPESQELYSKKYNEILQRDHDSRRIKKIKEYLLTQKERFFNSLVVAIHKGNPRWADFDIERQFRIDNELIGDSDVEFIENKLGILSLDGSEEIFVLDGQHRLLGIRAAYDDNPSHVETDEISVVMIVHKKELKERTRRLFTVLNRYAVKIKPAEQVILEEDDAAAILTRRLVDEYPMMKKDLAVSKTKSLGLPPKDFDSFTTLVCLYEINKVLIDYGKLYPTKVIRRKTDVEMEVMWRKIVAFWDKFFESFPQVTKVIEGQKQQNPADFNRNPHTGGSLLLRPEGQILIALLYQDYSLRGMQDIFWDRLTKIDFRLNGPIWMYVFWRGDKIEPKNKKLKKQLLQYLLGGKADETFIRSELKKIYEQANKAYDGHIVPVV